MNAILTAEYQVAISLRENDLVVQLDLDAGD
jgi:hypothetical protein